MTTQIPDQDRYLKCKCSICGEIYGAIDILTIRKPLDGSMFLSPDPIHGYPAPWQGDKRMTFNFMQCPYGPHRPFETEDHILTVKGRFDVFDVPRTAMPVERSDSGSATDDAPQGGDGSDGSEEGQEGGRTAAPEEGKGRKEVAKKAPTTLKKKASAKKGKTKKRVATTAKGKAA